MAFLSENWLKQEAARNRSHSPVSVRIELVDGGTDWDLRNNVVLNLNLHAVYGNGESKRKYKGLYLTDSDMNAFIDAFIPKLEEKSVATFFLALARRLSDKAILDQLAKARRRK